ncbi:MAG: Uma2 family endonuclease [Clostridiales Family XIII bacterium]|nr:Uma2 family endonuclease [Clostridiales Family XIII bacterium]
MALAKKEEYYTYADYLEWDTEERYELIDGVPYMMSPAPTPTHQRISAAFTRLFGNYLRGKTCEVFAAPFDVRLNADEEDDTVVQPDILIICDKTKIDDRGCKGAPDLVIEIVSKSSGNYDRGLKLHKYINAGVRECWIVDPDDKIVQVYILQADRSANMLTYHAEDTVPVSILQDLRIPLPEVFAGVTDRHSPA